MSRSAVKWGTVSLFAAAMLVVWYIFFGGSMFGSVVVDIPEGYERSDIARSIAASLDWPEEKRNELEMALRSVQWDALNEELADFMADEFSWSQDDREVFLTRADDLFWDEDDILSGAYVPKEYRIDKGDPPAVIAEKLVAEIMRSGGDGANLDVFFKERVSSDKLIAADEAVRSAKKMSVPLPGSGPISGARELLPDLLVLPPQDISIRFKDGRTLLVFGTTYYNIGDGPLEIVGDGEDGDIEGDYEGSVFQRIHQEEGYFYDEEIGVFLWHADHSHYHYSDFIDYALGSVDAATGENEAVRFQKSTYCVRDISRVGSSETPARYRSCGREIQGVSVGWGDTYFHTYGAQNFDITDLPSGIYALSFTVNPVGRIKELSRDNNTSSALIDIDKENGSAAVVEYSPKGAPIPEHVYPE